MMSLGVDIVEIERIKKNVENKKFLDLIYTKNEIKYYNNSGKRLETLAGLFAAKEAVLKVLNIEEKGLKVCDIEVLHTKTNAPFININNLRLKNEMEKIGITNIEISISHSEKYAISNAIGYKEKVC